MQPNRHIHLPLEEFFSRLQVAGFTIDTARKIRLFRLLDQEGISEVGTLANFKYKLAPFVATNPQEQERFYSIFDHFIIECEQELDDLFRERQDIESSDLVEPKGRNWWWTFLVGLLIVLLAVWIDQPFEPERILIEHSNSTIRERDTLSLRNLSKGINPSELFWEVRDKQSQVLLHTSAADASLQWPTVRAGQEVEVILRKRDTTSTDNKGSHRVSLMVHCADPPPAPDPILPTGPFSTLKKYSFSAKGETGLELMWIFDEKDTLKGAKVEYAFKQDGNVAVALLAAYPKQQQYCYNDQRWVLNIGTEKPLLLNVALKTDQKSTKVQRLRYWYWLFPLLMLLGAVGLWRRWINLRSKKKADKSAEMLAKEYAFHDAAPFYIPFLEQEDKISVSRDFFRIADILRRREEGSHRQFDVSASVQATIAAGNYPSWQERSNRQPSAWLVLIESPEKRRHLSQLFERLTRFMQRMEAPIEVFNHDGSFSTFWNDNQIEVFSLKDLHYHYPAHRIVLIGSSHGLVNPYSSDLMKDLIEGLRLWKRRMILTPSFPSTWSFEEMLLHRDFLLLPADTAGALKGFEQLDTMEEYEPGDFGRWKVTQINLRPGQTPQRWDTIRSHYNYLNEQPELYRWLCALSVCSKPEWPLIISIGRALGIEVTHDKLLTLARIPWLNANAPDTRLRLDFLRELTSEDELLARSAVAEELERVREQVQNSFAQTDWTNQLAVQRFALDPHNEQNKQILSELLRLGLLDGSQIAELEYVVTERMDKRDFPTEAFASLNTWLSTSTPPALYLKELMAASLTTVLTLLMVVYGCYAPLHQISSGSLPWIRLDSAYDPAVALNNKAVALWQPLDSIQIYDIWKNEQGRLLQIDSLLVRAVELRSPVFYALADSNLNALRYNSGVTWLNFFLDEKASASEALPRALQWLDRVPLNPNNYQLSLAAQHGIGLCHYYTNDSTGALRAYQTLMEQSSNRYFDSLSITMPANLQTLLLAKGWMSEQTRQPEIIIFSGVVQDSISGQPLAGVGISSGFVTSKTDDQGRYEISLVQNLVFNRYRLKFEETNSKTKEINLSSTNGNRFPIVKLSLAGNNVDNKKKEVINPVDDSSEQIFLNEDSLMHVFLLRLEARVNDAKTQSSIAGATVKVYDIGGATPVLKGKKTNLIGNDFLFPLDVNKRYLFKVSRPGYNSLEEELRFGEETVNSGGRITIQVPLERFGFDDFLPVSLYFDNSQPDSNSYSSTTTKNYMELNEAYYARKQKYIDEFTKGFSGEEKRLTERRYIDFFDREVDGSRQELEAFVVKLLEFLQNGGKIRIKLKGYASPRGSSAYNQRLSERRIDSILNFFKQYESGALFFYMRNGQLGIQKEALGESAAKKSVAARLDDPRNSIFSIVARVEDRVEIVEVKIPKITDTDMD